MSTMGMYNVRWPARKFGPKYAHKRPKLSSDFSALCQPHYVAMIDCIRKTTVMNRGVCDKYMEEMWDCVAATKRRQQDVKQAKYRLSKFMRGRDSFGLVI